MQMLRTRGCIVTLVAFVWLFSTVCFHMSFECPCMRWYIVTLVAFVWFNDIDIQDFPICSLETKLAIFKNLFHCHCVLCLAQIVSSNWSLTHIADPWAWSQTLANISGSKSTQKCSIQKLKMPQPGNLKQCLEKYEVILMGLFLNCKYARNQIISITE